MKIRPNRAVNTEKSIESRESVNQRLKGVKEGRGAMGGGVLEVVD